MASIRNDRCFFYAKICQINKKITYFSVITIFRLQVLNERVKELPLIKKERRTKIWETWF